MSFDTEKLYNLLPAIHRIRDDEQGKQLQALLSVIAEQVAVVEEDLQQLYDDQFIETCAEWVIPYIGDLVGTRSIRNVNQLNQKILNSRAFVANTITYRRRKGTASVLEQLARDVTGWDARVVEFFELLATTQYMKHLRPQNRAWVDMRRWEPLENINTAFDSLAHTAEMRRISPGRGRYNIPNLGIFLWRLTAYSLTNSPALKLDANRFLFHPLGINTQLFNQPETEEEITSIATRINVAMPLSRRVLSQYLTDYYGKGKSLLLKLGDTLIEVNQIIVCNLSDKSGGEWAHKPTDKIAIDPVLGRIAFPDSQNPENVRVTYHYGFSTDIGGGEYDRDTSLNYELQPVVQVPSQYNTIQAALDNLRNGGVVEIENSDRYSETLSITINPGQKLELRAKDEFHPTLILGGDLQIIGGENSEVTINGILISGKSLQVPATKADGSHNLLRLLRLRHCTLVPGVRLKTDGTPEFPDTPSLIVETRETAVEIDHSILGGIRVNDDAQVQIRNSIIDAIAEDKTAYEGITPGKSGAPLHIENSTVIGSVYTGLMELASNTIFLGLVRAERRQQGCVRFSYVSLASQVPRRYYCQPKTIVDAARVYPQFTSRRYSEPGYCQLSNRCAVEIRQGADDESEMGVFHDLYQPQRESHLRVHLDEYLRFGLEAGIFYVT
ncbi:hypothetical protein [Brasilonema sp. UFV-L1]|uniref:hypothetical protein n=1 Tax=Brasilonema sp. UFV-L1 TaxID=2234130 RepID=UPI00145F1BFA|nr:hypothetical protein [Brasilonema sp. UFV-L1]NMG08783.1 hypothetical protein [Brasilonema sp. UFV-L1]